jgi:hypothetical protein
MNQFVKLIPIVGLAACTQPRRDEVRREHPASAIVVVRTDTSPGGEILVTESDSFVHLKSWSRRDSLIGALVKLGHSRNGQSASDIALPADAEIGRTISAGLRALIGAPTRSWSNADTTGLEYASPFIGPDESATFVLVHDTLRLVRWSLFSE